MIKERMQRQEEERMKKIREEQKEELQKLQKEQKNEEEDMIGEAEQSMLLIKQITNQQLVKNINILLFFLSIQRNKLIRQEEQRINDPAEVAIRKEQVIRQIDKLRWVNQILLDRVDKL